MDEKLANDENLELLLEVSACVDGELPPERREALDERVRGDVRCAEAAHFFRWLDETAKRDAVPEVDSEEWAALWDKVERGCREEATGISRGAPEIVERRSLFRTLAPLAAAAALALAAFAAYYVIDSGAFEPPRDNDTAEAPEVTPSAPDDGTVEPFSPGDDQLIRLDDESSQPRDGVDAPKPDPEDPDEVDDPEDEDESTETADPAER